MIPRSYFAALAAVLVGCSWGSSDPLKSKDFPAWQPVDASQAPPAGPVVPPPVPVQIQNTPLAAGMPATLWIDVLPGHTVTFIGSIGGAGSGPCPPALGGECLGIVSPLAVIGTDVADAAGRAELSVTVPAALPPGQQVWFQAGIDSGAATAVSEVSTDFLEGGGPTGDTGGGPITAVLGQMCALTDMIGQVQLESAGGNLYVNGGLYDRPDPWLGPPAIVNGDCAYHTFNPGVCGGCGAQVCGFGGTCVPGRNPLTTAALTVRNGPASEVFNADPVGGWFNGTVTVGTATDAYTLEVAVGSTVVQTPVMTAASGNLADAVVLVDPDFFSPGPLTASWTPPPDGGVVGSRIPINHHVGGPTFTDCWTDASNGTFHATEPMIDPLAVITGLEFQGLSHVQVAAAETPQGCVEFRMGTTVYVGTTYR